MSVFVIAERDTELLDTPVFYAGEGGKEEAIAVFTSRNRVSQFIENAGWNGDQLCTELTAIDLLQLVVEAHKEGTQYLAVNPVRQENFAVEDQPVVIIERLMADFAEDLTEVVSEQVTMANGAADNKNER